MEDKTTIIPIASGKGGVGKSIFAANLAIALAEMGHSTVAVDLDLGGSNLHSCLGMPNRYPGIGDFLKSGKYAFKDLIVPTKIDRLKFVPGDGKTPFMADISNNQRRTLLKVIKNIRARYVILDLGAGTVFKTLNFYGLSYKGLIVSSFETPSIMNFMMFLRNFMFRILATVARKDKQVLNMLIQHFQQPIHSEPVTVRSLLERMSKMNPELASKAEKICAVYRTRVVFNMGDHPDDLLLLKKLGSTIRDGMSIQPEFFGFVFYDDQVRRCAKNRQVLLSDYPESIASLGIEFIAKRIIRLWDTVLTDTENHLSEITRKQYDLWKKRGMLK